MVFWDVVPCSLVDVYQSFVSSEDGGSRLFRNLSSFLSDYTASYCRSRRQWHEAGSEGAGRRRDVEFWAHAVGHTQDEYSCKPLKAITALVI
jgi:hypothetical protein